MRNTKLLKPKSVQVGELLQLVKIQELEELSQRLEADKWVTKFKASIVFQLILYTVLDSERISLRVMEDHYESAAFKALIGGEVEQRTAHSSIRDRIKTIKLSFFQQLYENVYRDVRKQYSDKALKHYNIKRYDSTMVSVFSHLLEGMKVGNTQKKKNQVKFTTELVNDFEVRMSFFKDQDHLGEEVALKELIQEQSHSATDLIVFDRGLKSRETFCELKNTEGQSTLFTTRLNDVNRYKFIRQHSEVPEEEPKLRFIQDSIVYLYANANKLVREEFRLIETEHKKTGKRIFFLTNIFDLPAQTVAEIYRRRWEIEVFFRFLKQEMNFTHFVCNDTNAIQVMMYATLIASMLVLVYKKKNEIPSYKMAKRRFIKEFEATILLELTSTPQGIEFYRQCLKHEVEKQFKAKKGVKKSANTS